VSKAGPDAVRDEAILLREVQSRLRAALALLSTECPEAAAKFAPGSALIPERNRLELFLTQLEQAAATAELPPPRGSWFWSGLLVAAMRLQLRSEFLRIAEREEPEQAYPKCERPCINCDFNGILESGVYSLDGLGTARSFARLGRVPEGGDRVVLFDSDKGLDENPEAESWLLVDAELVQHPPWGLVARVLADTWRWVPRSGSPSSSR
jgi:hypothetical protein